MSENPTPEKPLLPTLIIAALISALGVGFYYHSTTINYFQQEISTLNSKLEESRKAAENNDFLKELLGDLSIVEPQPGEPGGAPDNWIYGARTARFTLIELSDTECPYCRDHFPFVKELVETSGGHINAALMHVPAHGEASRNQAIGIECAGQLGGSDAAWKYASLVFRNTQSNGKGVPQSLATLAGEIGLNNKAFAACLDSPEVVEKVRTDLEQAVKLGVQQTPSTLVLDNETGNSMVLQGSNANRDTILQTMSQLASQAPENTK
ncbi:thioredoxin domain-containing protein [Aquipseudomonas alcaligenes]|uniref:Thioredoxin n=1 Tax=Aquipseudomonas alcaligenes TaxID=43263 RepID=A0A1N6XE74_AQUAC|nr:thioredoxin domain-containing protein [Pseudomonas alcaligenes]SIR00539.1 Thioredoxin [Pseudomonas alcaligenes]